MVSRVLAKAVTGGWRRFEGGGQWRLTELTVTSKRMKGELVGVGGGGGTPLQAQACPPLLPPRGTVLGGPSRAQRLKTASWGPGKGRLATKGQRLCRSVLRPLLMAPLRGEVGIGGPASPPPTSEYFLRKK